MSCGTFTMRATGFTCIVPAVPFRLVGYPPFNFEDNEELMECSRKGKYFFESPFWDDISAEAKHFVSSLMTLDPSQRLSAQQALNHPW